MKYICLVMFLLVTFVSSSSFSEESGAYTCTCEKFSDTTGTLNCICKPQDTILSSRNTKGAYLKAENVGSVYQVDNGSYEIICDNFYNETISTISTISTIQSSKKVFINVKEINSLIERYYINNSSSSERDKLKTIINANFKNYTKNIEVEVEINNIQVHKLVYQDTFESCTEYSSSSNACEITFASLKCLGKIDDKGDNNFSDGKTLIIDNILKIKELKINESEYEINIKFPSYVPFLYSATSISAFENLSTENHGAGTARIRTRKIKSEGDKKEKIDDIVGS